MSGRPVQEAAKADPGGLGREGAAEHGEDGGLCTEEGKQSKLTKKVVVTISASDTRSLGRGTCMISQQRPSHVITNPSRHSGEILVYSTIFSLFQGYKAHNEITL